MYIKLTKVNYKKHKIGSIIKVPKDTGEYLIRSKVAELVEEKEKKERK